MKTMVLREKSTEDVWWWEVVKEDISSRQCSSDLDRQWHSPLCSPVLRDLNSTYWLRRVNNFARPGFFQKDILSGNDAYYKNTFTSTILDQTINGKFLSSTYVFIGKKLGPRMIMDERTWHSAFIRNRNKIMNLGNEVFSLTTRRCFLLFPLLYFFHYDGSMDRLDAFLRKHLKDFTVGLTYIVFIC